MNERTVRNTMTESNIICHEKNDYSIYSMSALIKTVCLAYVMSKTS